jgi:putative hemolysin
MGKLAILGILAVALLLLGCAAPQSGPGKQNSTPPPPPAANSTNITVPPPPPSENQTEIANPASKYCVDRGFELVIKSSPSGQIGYCVFANGNECEEWAYFRGECNESQTPRKPAGEGEFCGGIAGFACQSGLNCQLEGTYPDAGGRCVKPGQTSENIFFVCPPERNDACTMEYLPVCGRAASGSPEVAGYGEYSNACVACSRGSNAIGYYLGTCLSRQN